MREFFKKWFITPINRQLTQGTSPNELAWAAAIGLVFGVIPIMGSTSLICFFLGWLFKLNQAILHLFKTIVYPLHILLILFYIRAGQKMNGVEPLSISLPEIKTQFQSSPLQFFSDFGLALLYGLEVWFISSLFALPILFCTFLFLFKITAAKIRGRPTDR